MNAERAHALAAAAALALQRVGRGNDVPGAVAGVTDRARTRHLGAAGTRDLGTDEPMTTDAVWIDRRNDVAGF